jgi:tRNA nucleotidyltransferase (CCA-adding enzyme)
MKKREEARQRAREKELRELLIRRFDAEAPAALLEILSVLREAGFRAYVVGGSVRDILLERPVKDWDVSTDARPEEVTGIFPRTLPTGIAHGTVTVLHAGRSFEVTTFRQDSDYPDARHPEKVFYTDDVKLDLSRRDFTVNAIAYEPEAKEIVCPHQGLDDIAARVIRTVGDPVERFREDGLRPVRAVRFACQLDFEIDREIFDAIGVVLDRVSLVSAERVRDELMKILECRKPSRGIELMRRSGLLRIFLPELDASRGVMQNEFHAYDVYWHSLHTCDAVPAGKPLLKLAALLHDIGKPSTLEDRQGRITFYNHQHVGKEMVWEMMSRLKFSNADKDYVMNLVDNHMFDYRSEWTDGALRRFIKRVGVDSIADAFDLRIADFLGNGLKQGFPQYLEEMKERIEGLLQKDSAFSVKDLAVDGRDVMRELGIGPEKRVGTILKELLELVLDDPSLNTREELLRRLKNIRASQ